MTGLRWRILGPPALISLCLVTLCGVTALSLFRQQATTASVLQESVASRRAATELEECIADLVALLQDRVESVSVLHERALTHLQKIQRYADQPMERALAARLEHTFAMYLERWKTMVPPGEPGHEQAIKEATRLLESDFLKDCLEFEQYNNRRIEEATQQHEQILRRLAWGMAGVSGLGGVAGLFLGFGVSRSLSQSIRKLQVQILDAAGKLGPDLQGIIVTEEGAFDDLHDQIDRLTGQIEGVVRELQERKLEVLRAEQLAAVGQLAAGVGHEIRNPLTSIKMLVQAGLEDSPAPGLAGEDLRVIEQEVRRMEKSLRTFLDFARPPKLERRPVDMVNLVQAVFGLVRGRADKQRVALRLHASPEGAQLIADGEQLQQVLVNLVLNALDAMPSGGTLTATVRQATSGEVAVEVADTGPGIPAELMPRLFEPFASGKDTGLGLGLVVSRRIVEDHGGTITAGNQPGGGAVFLVVLPPGARP